MFNFQFVLDYKLFEKVDVGVAEELLNEYKDFYEYNKMQVTQVVNPTVADTFDVEAVPAAETETVTDTAKAINEQRLQHNRNVSLNHFEKLFGNLDFAEACMVGLKIDFYELQKILMAEYRQGVPITESSLNAIAPRLRALASVLLYAERIVIGLEKMAENSANIEKIQMAAEFAKDGFILLLERLLEKEIPVPEYHKNKKELKKIKTIDAYINYCEKLFFISEGNE